MLDPHDRRHLIEALRPPPGYQLDYAIGTTYSLDLLALLTAPLAFTFFDWEADGALGRPTADPLALLEALRRHADRITIFCDAGRIAIPSDSQQLFAYLEGSVVEARAPRGGAFHPKVWVLRFLGVDDAVAYRVLCLSRNLTFDRCWDTLLVLDGVLPANGVALPGNAPLCAFVAALPAMTVRGELSDTARERITVLANELACVPFEPPPGFEALAFHPLGLAGTAIQPFGTRYDGMLVIAPFVSASRLGELGRLGQNNILVARLEELQTLAPSALRAYQRIFTLSPDANPEDADETLAEERSQDTLVGLHAKLFVADDGEQAHIWTGSANASDAAFTTNVEFLVELTGPRRRCGIEAVLGENRDGGPVGLIALLQPFDPNQPPVEIDPAQQALDDLVEDMRQRIARLDLAAHITPGSTDDVYDVTLQLPTGTNFMLPDVTVRCWPITRSSLNISVVETGTPTFVRFNDLSFEALTSFFAISVEAARGGIKSRCAFVLNLPLLGAPENRRERLLHSLLQSRDQVLRFLLLLLADDSELLAGMTMTIREPGQVTGVGQAMFGLPLFEALVRALDRDPDKIEHIARIVDDLCKTAEGRQLLPETFDSIWAPIWAAHTGVQA